ncbi:MAG: AzlD domain-containing protein [Spirochaetales bacterium]|nr:AzlD domain-containing protein [Spirochaetales bacterium]MCF7939352.1 AzlD domain-containing protein [Spirochaetales bacterium]
MRSEIFLLLAGMTAVTYIPRMLPFVLIDFDRLPSGLRRFLGFIPVTALGALILPGIFLQASGRPVSAMLVIGVAGTTGWFFRGLAVPVILSIAAAWVTGIL